MHTHILTYFFIWIWWKLGGRYGWWKIIWQKKDWRKEYTILVCLEVEARVLSSKFKYILMIMAWDVGCSIWLIKCRSWWWNIQCNSSQQGSYMGLDKSQCLHTRNLELKVQFLVQVLRIKDCAVSQEIISWSFWCKRNCLVDSVPFPMFIMCENSYSCNRDQVLRSLRAEGSRYVHKVGRNWCSTIWKMWTLLWMRMLLQPSGELIPLSTVEYNDRIQEAL